LRQKPREEQGDYDENGMNFGFHIHGVFGKLPQLVENNFWGAHAARVHVSAPSPKNLDGKPDESSRADKFRDRECTRAPHP
jgi:hypothetical protein